MRVSIWPAFSIGAAVLVTAGVIGCSSPGTSDTAAPAPAPAPTAAPAAEAAAPIAATPAPAASPAPMAPTPAPAVAPSAAAPGPRPAARPAPSAPPAPSVAAAPAPSAPAAVPAPAPKAPPAPEFREVTVPSGTALSIELKTTHASDTSRVEDTVRGVLRRPLEVDGVEIAPAGAAVTGQVTAADRAGRVKGRARLVLRFASIVIDESATAISTVAIAREAESTKKEDAAKIGIGAGAGAVIGAITGGKKGAVVGGTVGAGAGTGVVLATRGDEVSLAAGTTVATSLSQPLVVRVRLP